MIITLLLAAWFTLGFATILWFQWNQYSVITAGDVITALIWSPFGGVLLLAVLCVELSARLDRIVIYKEKE